MLFFYNQQCGMKNLIISFVLLLSPLFLTAENANQKNPVKQISNYFEKTDLSVIPNFKSIEISVEINKDTCKYQNTGLNYGSNVYPKISDPKRVKAIVDLITKIIKCEPLPFKEDGQTFLNKEKRLPDMPKGYYQEYTLIIPKDSDQEFYIGDVKFTAYPSYGSRGPERIVIGGGKTIYYTPTHYDSFVEIKLR